MGSGSTCTGTAVTGSANSSRSLPHAGLTLIAPDGRGGLWAVARQGHRRAHAIRTTATAAGALQGLFSGPFRGFSRV